MERSEGESFLSADGHGEPVVRFQWDGETALGLELLRPKVVPATRTVHWGAGALGVTLGVDAASQRVIVTRTTRSDVKAGDVLLRARGEPIEAADLATRLTTLQKEHELVHGIPFQFASPPPPVYVKSCGDALQLAGVDASFELHSVDDRVVRYLEMSELQRVIREAAKPCALSFVQRKENRFLAVLQQREDERKQQERLGHTAAASAGLALAAALIVSIY